MTCETKRVRVGINATCINDRPSGAKQRFVGLYGAIAKLLPNIDFIIFEPSDCTMSNWFDSDNVFFVKTNIPSNSRFRRIIRFNNWNKAIASEKIDIFENINLPIVKSNSGITLLTIHDVRGIYFNRFSIKAIIWKCVLKYALKNADHVITVSKTMRDEILDFYSRSNISVVYNGIDKSFFNEIDKIKLDQAISNLNLPNNFVLSVGHLESRKNYKRLIKAFIILRNNGCKLSLVIIGNDSGQRSVFDKIIAEHNAQKYIFILHNLSDYEIRCLYRLSKLFIFPSIYEGFGIPIIEAMASKTPLVLSDIPVFREITQDQAYYFNPYNVSSIADAIEGALSNEELMSKQALYGRKRVKSFFFENLAKKMSNIYAIYYK